jgi:hypothetical protein
VIQDPDVDLAKHWRTVSKALVRLHELERPKRGKPRLVWPPAAAIRAEPEIEGLKGLIRLRGWDIYLAAGPRGMAEAFLRILGEQPNQALWISIVLTGLWGRIGDLAQQGPPSPVAPPQPPSAA